jgi:cytochrome b subunit of formate dehydrogenase
MQHKEVNDLNRLNIKNQSVQKYSISTIFAHWIMVISVIGLIMTGCIPLFNKILDIINLVDITLPILPLSSELHSIFGFMLVFSIIFVIFTHTIDMKDILSSEVSRDIGSLVRSILYIIGLEKRLERGSSNKFYGYQKITFVLFIFSLWMLMFSGLILFFNPGQVSDVSETFMGPIGSLHLLGTLIILLLVLYHIVMAVRRFDKNSFRCIFIDGTLPLGYVKEHHKLWYDELKEEMVKKQKI